MYKLIYQLLPYLYTNGTVRVLLDSQRLILKLSGRYGWRGWGNLRSNVEAREKAKKRAITTVMTLTTNSLLK